MTFEDNKNTGNFDFIEFFVIGEMSIKSRLSMKWRSFIYSWLQKAYIKTEIINKFETQ